VPLSSENDFLALIDRHFPADHPHLRLGRGDDCAVITCPPEMCVTTDLFLEDVHFRRSYFSAADVGHKALAVNLSDVSAMGARPLGFSLGLTIPAGLPDAWWEEMFSGMAGLAGEAGVALTGGDLSAGGKVGLCLTVWGAPPPGGRFLRRRQGLPGDVLFLVGEVGLARTGLHLLEAGAEASAYPASKAAHLRPGLHLGAALALSTAPGVRGLMDVSDGLAMDLPRFLAPGTGADLRLAPADLHPEIVAYTTAHGRDPVRWAVRGGEDYALLGACAPDAWPELAATLPGARAIGAVTSCPGLFLSGRPLDLAGFDHFAPHD